MWKRIMEKEKPMGQRKAASDQLDDERGKAGDNFLGPAGAEHLRALESRIMSLLDQRDEINADIKEVFAEAGDSGFHSPTLRKAIARKRAMDKDLEAFRAAEEQLDLYFSTLYQAELPGFEPLNPGLAENREKTAVRSKAKAPKTVVPALETADPGGPTDAETVFN
jgi:uncharacterized protein (UPF0335 family)